MNRLRLLTTPVTILAKPLRLIPNALHSEIVARACNHFMRGQGLEDRLKDLEGKSLCIHVTDIPLTLSFTINNSQLFRSRSGHWDARISGEFVDFWLLATRAEDPDTLFFNRRLNIEGNTEVGLTVKNLLDALDFDWQAHITDVFGHAPPHVLVKLARRLREQLPVR